jgi:hypothetical protein
LPIVTRLVSSLFGLSTNQALVVLFVLLPFAVAAIIIPLVAWRSRNWPKPMLTSEILATGERADGEIVSVRNLGTIVDLRPMVKVVLNVTTRDGAEPFELEVVQSFPRSVIYSLRPGERVDVRLSPDRSAGAVVWDTGASRF